MPVTAKRARELALSLENTSSYPHFDRIAFRTPRRTFATLALSGSDMNFMFDLAEQAHFCALAPDALAPVPGGWGRMGWTSCELSRIDAATFKAALQTAHARANQPRAKKKAARKPQGDEKASGKPRVNEKAARKPQGDEKAGARGGKRRRA